MIRLESDIVIPTEKYSTVLKSRTTADNVAWFLANRRHDDPRPPNHPEAHDNEAFSLEQTLFENMPAEMQDFSITVDKTLVGFINLYPKSESEALLGYKIARLHRRNGYATTALRALSAYTKSEEGYATNLLHIDPVNVASQRVASKAGYRQVGHYDRYLLFSQ